MFQYESQNPFQTKRVDEIDAPSVSNDSDVDGVNAFVITCEGKMEFIIRF